MTERGAALLIWTICFVIIGAYVVRVGSKKPPKPIVIVVPVDVPKNLKDWI
jgi:hypothetical protein